MATACVLPGTVAFPIARHTDGRIQVIEVEHPSGRFEVRLELGGTADDPTVERGGVIRTARALFDGTVFPRSGRATSQVSK